MIIITNVCPERIVIDIRDYLIKWGYSRESIDDICPTEAFSCAVGHDGVLAVLGQEVIGVGRGAANNVLRRHRFATSPTSESDGTVSDE